MFESAMRNDRSPKLVSGQCLVRSESSANFMRFIELLFQGDLLQLEKLIVSMGDRDDSLLEIVNEVSKRHDSPEFRCYARRLAWKEGTISKSAVVIEFRLLRARRSLYLSSSPKLRSQVCEHLLDSTIRNTSESPAIMMRQVGRIAAIPRGCTPPPLFSVA
ncbi:MAG: hypothetical protein QG574_5261 [Cyanobacteriota bacterium erpe_2018_sw_21hr_WHONDRS-SW48-000092_B_bin.40]|nr:hypothetical protein [Cyanobacteriota bacterium erpe_2018_sw_21hr_WHONDRS-SW48-000092_B_bin.40]